MIIMTSLSIVTKAITRNWVFGVLLSAIFLSGFCSTSAATKPPKTVLPDTAPIICDFTADSLMMALSLRPLHQLEGIWCDPATGAEIAIVADNRLSGLGFTPETLLIVVLRSPSIGIHRGTLAGWINPTARQGYYEAKMFTKYAPGALSNPKTYHAHMVGNALSMTKLQKGVRIVLRNLLPFTIRHSVREQDNTPREISGYLRIWPENPDNPSKPRVL